VVGPRHVFPFAADRTFTPQDAAKEDLFALHTFLGFERRVFVQSGAHGGDHAVVLDLLTAGQGRYRAVGLINPSFPKAKLMRLHDAGICGARFHFFAHLGAPMPYADIRAGRIPITRPHPMTETWSI